MFNGVYDERPALSLNKLTDSPCSAATHVLMGRQCRNPPGIITGRCQIVSHLLAVY